MRKLITTLFIFVTVLINAQTHTSVQTGAWENSDTWDQITYPNLVSQDVKIDNTDSVDLTTENIEIGILVFGNNSILYIGSSVTLTVDSISILNNAKLYVDGILIINGGINLNNNSSLDIDLGGSINIFGDVDGGNNVNLNIDGTMDVDGNFSLDAGSTVDGSGDITVGGTVNIPTGSDPNIIINNGLPVNLLYFRGYYKINYIEFSWATASEINNSHFIIQYSKNGINWNDLTYINGYGYTNFIIEYKYKYYTDNSCYYRLKQVDFNNDYKIFDVIFVSVNSLDQDMYYNVYDLYGRLIKKDKPENIRNSNNGFVILKQENGQGIKYIH